MQEKQAFRSGFINIVGKPNAGKSTLMNALVGERISIITNKPQTTRHRIIGIVSDEKEGYQMVFSDTPGFIKKANYKMQERMNSFVYGAFEDADMMIWVLDAKEPFGEEEQKLLELMKGVLSPVFLVINKIDLFKPEEIEAMVAEWKTRMNFKAILPIAALHKTGTEELFQALLAELHEGPAYYPHDQLTDRPERFFVSEIIREKILENYHQEIPYSCEVVVNSYKEDSDRARNLVRIECTIYVSRQSQKPIMIGQKGQAIKNLGIKSREAIERFTEKNVHLELFVKVKEDWRDNERTLDLFGYQG